MYVGGCKGLLFGIIWNIVNVDMLAVADYLDLIN